MPDVWNIMDIENIIKLLRIQRKIILSHYNPKNYKTCKFTQEMIKKCRQITGTWQNCESFSFVFSNNGCI